jgi:hypothetical protein
LIWNLLRDHEGLEIKNQDIGFGNLPPRRWAVICSLQKVRDVWKPKIDGVNLQRTRRSFFAYFEEDYFWISIGSKSAGRVSRGFVHFS